MNQGNVDVVTGEVIEPEKPMSMAIVQAQEAAATDIAVRTAKAYPRSVQTFQRDLETWATASEAIAEECFYNLERKKKGGDKTIIIGPSIRFAELLQTAYTNLVVKSTIIEEAERYVVVEAQVRDMERNVGLSAQVRRSIWGTYGRFSENMIQTTIQAATSLAIRNAIVRMVPKALWLPIWEKAKAVARGDVANIAEGRTKAAKALQSVGVTDERVLRYLGKPSWKDVDADDLVALRVLFREIRDGQTDPSEVGAEEPDETAAEQAAADTQERIEKAAKDAPKKKAAKKKAAKKKAKKAAKKKAAKPEPEPEPEEEPAEDDGATDDDDVEGI